MKNVFKKFVTATVAIAVAATTVFAMTGCGGVNYAENNTTYKIGVSGPLTGDAAVYGNAVKNAAQMAVDEINANGGFHGTNFELVSYDDQAVAEMVNTGYASMYEGGMQVSLGCVTSGACLEWAKLSNEDNVFFLTPSASNDTVTTFGDNSYQMCFADGNQGKVAADYVASQNLSEIGIFYKSDDPYSKGIYDQFKANLPSTVKTVEASFLGNATDFTSHVDKLKDCDFIFMPIYYTPASAFMVQAKGKVADNATYYGCDGFDGIDSAEGFNINDIPQKVQMLSHFNSKAEDGAAKSFVDKYTAKYGKDTLNQFGAAAYDCVYAIYNAMEKAYAKDNSSVYVTMSAGEMCDVLTGVFNDGFTYSGVTGTDIQWQADGAVDKQAIAYVIKEADKD